MPSEHGFGDDGTKATRFCKPDDGDDQMKEKGQDVVDPGIVTKSQKAPEFRPILRFAMDTFGEKWERVEYSLTRYGRTLVPVLTRMAKWGEAHREYIEARPARAQPKVRSTKLPARLA